MKVYSNVLLHKETGDLLGYDLAINRDGGSRVTALLYVYEGGESASGVLLSGQIAKKRLLIGGNWTEHLIEYPSKKETVQDHLVKINGILNSAAFRGDLTIDGILEHQRVRLNRVKNIWSCKNLRSSLN